ncbi:EIF2B4 [Bugula neritina]|uniref:Translation initiation factor eIF2B subunit delta n=1 Tax=Bugula neritina TaxID=10212 RepID=A0A7J7IVR8_BUGNE|nr:EIF2B4 [Bugula neritina]
MKSTSLLQQAKQYIVDELERFYKERIQSSDDVISQKALEKINGDDVIITFGHSSVILKVLTEAAKKHPKLSVIIVDSRPKFEGREMLRKLMRSCPSLSCSYVFINSISYVMPLATKVLVGAYAVLANGHVMSRIVCCETYKFASRMQTDSYVSNELGDSKQLMNINNRAGPLSDIASRPNLHVLNICYDVTPPDYVTGLITETAVIPCTSAPVVIRVKQQYNIVNMKPYA